MTDRVLEKRLRALLDGVLVLPQRLSLRTPGVLATAPMLRGVWGAALRSAHPALYDQIFVGGRGANSTPLYIVRPAAPDPADAPALDWILFGDAVRSHPRLIAAWRQAAARGLGSERRRFAIRRVRTYLADGSLSDSPSSPATCWSLSQATWPLPSDAPCRVTFRAPLRILRRGNLVSPPTLADLTVAAFRRVVALLRPARLPALAGLQSETLATARKMSAEGWEGERLDLRRWSGRQQRELQLRGVTGRIELPAGPGSLSPLLAAAQWAHIGKATTVGLGQLTVEPTE